MVIITILMVGLILAGLIHWKLIIDLRKAGVDEDLLSYPTIWRLPFRGNSNEVEAIFIGCYIKCIALVIFMNGLGWLLT